MGFWDGSIWLWSLEWKRVLRPHDLAEQGRLLSLLDSVAPDPQCTDKFIWAPDKNDKFSVKSLTGLLDSSSAAVPFEIFKNIWKGLVPHRVEIFIWFALLGKLNTRGKLSRLSIIPPYEASCVFCRDHIEFEDHLFIHCDFARGVWNWWLSIWGVRWVLPISLKDLFSQ